MCSRNVPHAGGLYRLRQFRAAGRKNGRPQEFCACARWRSGLPFSSAARVTSVHWAGGVPREPGSGGCCGKRGSRRCVVSQADLYFKEMFSFFRKNQETKKVLVSEKEADGFVFLGNTINEESNDSSGKSSLYMTESGGNQTAQTVSENQPKVTEVETEKNQTMESHSSMLELLSDVPFTLAPHVLAAQDACNDLSGHFVSYDVNDNLTRFWYDFTLENSVLCES